MKHLLAICAAFLFGMSASAQRRSLPYSVVLDSFFAKYEPANDGILRFAKKPDGWWVGIVNPASYSDDKAPELLSNNRFRTSSTGRFEALPEDYFTGATDPESQRQRYLTSSEGSEWYYMQRNLYYGYNGWDLDVMRELGPRSDAGLNDTLRESLGRAYDQYASRFMWYHMGGRPLSPDPLQQRRPAGTPVPAAAADSAVRYIRLAIGQYRAIVAHNPGYSTKVGSAPRKLFCQLMYGWHAMEMAGYPEKGKPFLEDLKAYLATDPALAQTVAAIADAHLAACPKAAVLFAYGDMDTYPLWYDQHALGQRTDVAVVNTSLLGLPQYLPWMQRSTGLALTVGPTIYNDQAFSYVSFRQAAIADGPGDEQSSGAPSPSGTPVREFLSNLLTSRYTTKSSDGSYGSHEYNPETLTLSTAGKTQSWRSLGYRMEKELKIATPQYVLLYGLLELDIVAQHLGQRPILYTSNSEGLFERYLFPLGMDYQLIPADASLDTNQATAAMVIMDYIRRHPASFSAPASATNTEPLDFSPLMTAYFFAGDYFDKAGKKPEQDSIADCLLRFAKASAISYPGSTVSAGAWLMRHGYHPPALKALFEQALQLIAEADRRRDDALDGDPGSEPFIKLYVDFFESLYEAAGWDTDKLKKVLKSGE